MNFVLLIEEEHLHVKTTQLIWFRYEPQWQSLDSIEAEVFISPEVYSCFKSFLTNYFAQEKILYQQKGLCEDMPIFTENIEVKKSPNVNGIAIPEELLSQTCYKGRYGCAMLIKVLGPP